jgi:hypothetical protein
MSLRVIFVPRGVEDSVCPSVMLTSTEYPPLGVNKGVNISPRIQSSTLGAKFTLGANFIPRGKLMLLKTILCNVPTAEKSRVFVPRRSSPLGPRVKHP